MTLHLQRLRNEWVDFKLPEKEKELHQKICTEPIAAEVKAKIGKSASITYPWALACKIWEDK